MSSTTRRGESIASALATSSRLMRVRPARFSGCASSSASNDCKREVNAAPRFQILLEPMSRKAGSWESRSASLTSSYPASRLYTDCRTRSVSGNLLQGGYYCCDQERHEFGDVLEGVEV